MGRMHEHRGWIALYVLIGLLALANAGVCGAAEVVLGPVHELKVLDDFGPASQKLWKTRVSSNTRFEMTPRSVPGLSDSLLQVSFTRRNDGKNAWFDMERALPAGTIGKDARGLRLLIGSPSGGKWWMRLTVRVDGKSYSYTMETAYPDRKLIEWDVPFGDFKAGTEALDRTDAQHIKSVKLEVAPRDASIYVDRLATYAQQAYASWLSFASSEPTNNLFQPREAVKVTLTPGGTVPAAARGFRYAVEDFGKNVVEKGTVMLDGAKSYTLDLTPKTFGFYELRAWWVGADGKDLEDRSCIRARGSMPQGIATFAVMPRTLQQNIALMKHAGQNAFFGLHGDFMDVADNMGCTWRLVYDHWQFLEPRKPDRSHGLAPWARRRMAEPPAPAYRMSVQTFTANQTPPAWAKSPANTAPPYAHWSDYLAMVRDAVEVHMHQYPQMHPRVYGAAWEVDLNFPPSNFKPPYTPADVVDLYRRQRATIKALDPDAMIIGPCPSTMNVAWFEKIFEAGLLKYVDGIETHGYADGVFAPEENDYPGKIAAIRALMKKYNHGKVLPIFVTEAAYPGVLGTKIIYRKQAEMMTRLAIILKGEGIRVFLPFYGIDFGDNRWWGFQFNLELDKKWSTKRVSPKPTVSAIAACVGLLEGAQPVRRVKGLGKDVWAYLFDKESTGILAIWTPTAEKRVTLDVGNAGEVEVFDIMGHGREMPVGDGRLQLTVGPAPQYVVMKGS